MAEELLLTAYQGAWNHHDAVACAACFAPGATREMRLRRPVGPVSSTEPARGREAIRAQIAAVIDAIPDLVVEVLAAGYASDRRLWTEWRLAGTCADGRRPVRAVTVLGVSVFRFGNDGFHEERLYWDSASAR